MTTEKKFRLTRRDAMALGLGATAASFLPDGSMAATQDAIAAFTGGAGIGTGDLTMRVPSVVANGDTVGVRVDSPNAVAIIILATANPAPLVKEFNFGALAGPQTASAQVRLAVTQDVMAIARMPDGSFVQTVQSVKVINGGML